MATSIDALLRLTAKVEGAGAVQGLAQGLSGVEKAALSTSKGLRVATGAAAGLSGAMGALLPLLSGAGLATMITGTINAADNMNDLSQQTGVAVESLAKFNKAAGLSGTTIEGVAGGLVKLSKGIAAGQGPAVDALNALGISAKDAAGNFKSADVVLVEVSDRFAAIPDGVTKTALAVQLFGKSGADLIPMLNMGGQAITSLSSKMDTAFAQKADAYSDKIAILGGKVRGLGLDLTVALLPALESITDGLTSVISAFSELPGWVQTAIGIAAGVVVAWGPVSGVISGVGVAITGLIAVLTGPAGLAVALGTVATVGIILLVKKLRGIKDEAEGIPKPLDGLNKGLDKTKGAATAAGQGVDGLAAAMDKSGKEAESAAKKIQIDYNNALDGLATKMTEADNAFQKSKVIKGDTFVIARNGVASLSSNYKTLNSALVEYAKWSGKAGPITQRLGKGFGQGYDDVIVKAALSTEDFNQVMESLGITVVNSTGDILTGSSAVDALAKQLEKLKEPPDLNASGEAFKRLGIEVDGLKQRQPADVLQEIIEKLQAMPESAEKSALAMSLLGSSYQELLGGVKQASIGLPAAPAPSAAAPSGPVNVPHPLDGLKEANAQALAEADLRPGIQQWFDNAVAAVNETGGELAAAFKLSVDAAIGQALLVLTGNPGWFADALLGETPSIDEAMASLFGGIQNAAAGFGEWWSGNVKAFLLEPFNTISEAITGSVGGIFEMVKAPVLAFGGWYGETLYKLFVEPYQAIAAATMQALEPVWQGVKDGATIAWTAVSTVAGEAWAAVIEAATGAWGKVQEGWTALSTWFSEKWQAFTDAFNDLVVNPVKEAWQTVTTAIPNAMDSAAKAVQNIWNGIIDGIKGAIRGLLQFFANAINGMVGLANKVIGAVNGARNAVGLSSLTPIGEVQVPAFARGGAVNGPTLALIGEGGEREYVVPESKMAAAAVNYLSGRRGAAVIPAFAEGGTVGFNTINTLNTKAGSYVSGDFNSGIGFGYGPGGGFERDAIMAFRSLQATAEKQLAAQQAQADYLKGIQERSANLRTESADSLLALINAPPPAPAVKLPPPPPINITTGPVIRNSEGEWVSMKDFLKALADSARDAAADGARQAIEQLRSNPSVRQRVGLA